MKTVNGSAHACTLSIMLFGSMAAAQDNPADNPTMVATDRPTMVAAPSDDDVMRYPPSSVRTGLMASGLGIMALSYGLSAISASVWSDVPGSGWLYAPVIGPWAAMAHNDCAADDPDCGAILAMRYILYAIDGIAQAGAVGLMGEAVFMTTEANDPNAAQLTVRPSVNATYSGVTILGSF